jgi:hypothetical protein
MALSDAEILPSSGDTLPAEITPAAPAAAAPAPEAESPIPDEVAKNPVVVSVLTGSVPGVLVRPLYYPEAYKLGTEFGEDIRGLGLEFYGAQDGSTVLYNPAKVTTEELAAADKEGVLSEMLPDYEQLTGETPQTPPKGAEGFQSPDSLLKVAGTPRTMAQGGTPKPDRDAQQKINTARVNNMLPSGPVSGALPVSGATSRALAKPAI